MRVSVLEGHDFAAWRAEHARGERPSLLPYGLEHLAEAVELRHSDATHAEDRLSRLLRRRDPQLPYGLRYRGALGQVVTALPQLARADVCLAIFEHHADVYQRLLTRARRALPPLALFSCYLSQWLTGDDPRLRRRAAAIARAAGAISVFSSNQVQILAAEAGVDPERVTVIPYGIDTDFYTPGGVAGGPESGSGGAGGGAPVVAVGRDSGRDWATFLAAAAQTPEIPYRLATPPWMLEHLTLPANVEFLGELDHDGYRELLRSASLVVVPTHEYAYPTGQSVMLEAMACGCPVVVTGTEAMRDYLTDATRPHAPGDPADLARVVREVCGDPAARERMAAAARPTALERFSTRRMWEAALPVIHGARARQRV